MDFQKLSTKFRHFEGAFPEEALIESIQNREAVIPELLKIIDEARAESRSVIEREDYMLCIYAIYLLAQFREVQAYPAIVDFFSRPGNRALEVVGDMYIEDLGRILASVSCGDIPLLQQLIENPEAQELLRSAGIEALMVLVRVGEKTRDEIINYFEALFRGKLERRKSLVWVSLVTCCVDLYPDELLTEIETAIEAGLVDESLVDLEKVYDVMLLDKNQAREKFFESTQYTLIEDVVREMAEGTGSSETR